MLLLVVVHDIAVVLLVEVGIQRALRSVPSIHMIIGHLVPVPLAIVIVAPLIVVVSVHVLISLWLVSVQVVLQVPNPDAEDYIEGVGELHRAEDFFLLSHFEVTAEG